MTSTKESTNTTIVLSKGQWYWKEDDNTLDFRPSPGSGQPPTIEKQSSSIRKRGRADTKGRSSDRRTPSAGIRGKQRQKDRGGKADAEEEDRQITLTDVKNVALAMMREAHQRVDSPWFQEILLADQLDSFLETLLLYFHWFFEKRTLDTKVYPANVHKSQHEIQDYEEICVKVKSTEKVIGRSYCVLILGKGTASTHHMSAGDSRVSATKNDREMYETLYSFCTYVVWLTYRRREFDKIEKEVGRLFRSETFNLAMREKNFDVDENGNEKNRHVTPAQYRRMHPKRPAINDIVNQRSPALTSILPRPKESANWLYSAKKDFEKLSNEQSVPKDTEQLPEPEKLGILGDMLSQYNPETLAPAGAEENEDPAAQQQQQQQQQQQPEEAATDAEQSNADEAAVDGTGAVGDEAGDEPDGVHDAAVDEEQEKEEEI